MATLEAIKYARGKLEVLDQLKLPHEYRYDNIKTCEEAFDCIKSMRVRGIVIVPDVSTTANALKRSTCNRNCRRIVTGCRAGNQFFR